METRLLAADPIPRRMVLQPALVQEESESILGELVRFPVERNEPVAADSPFGAIEVRL